MGETGLPYEMAHRGMAMSWRSHATAWLCVTLGCSSPTGDADVRPDGETGDGDAVEDGTTDDELDGTPDWGPEDGGGADELPGCPGAVLGVPHIIYSGTAANGVLGVASGDDYVAVLHGDGSDNRVSAFDRAGASVRSRLLDHVVRGAASNGFDILVDALTGAGSECELETRMDVVATGGESVVDSGAGRLFSLAIPDMVGARPIRALALGPTAILEYDVEWVECRWPGDIVSFAGHVRVRDRADPGRVVVPDPASWYADQASPLGAVATVGDRLVVLTACHVYSASRLGPPYGCNSPDLGLTVFDQTLAPLGVGTITGTGSTLRGNTVSLAGGRSSALVAGIRDNPDTGWSVYRLIAIDLPEDRVPQVVADYDLVGEWLLRLGLLGVDYDDRAAVTPAGSGFALVAARYDEPTAFRDVELVLVDGQGNRVAEIPMPAVVPPQRTEPIERGYAVAATDRCVDVVSSVGTQTGTGMNDVEVTLQSYCCPGP